MARAVAEWMSAYEACYRLKEEHEKYLSRTLPESPAHSARLAEDEQPYAEPLPSPEDLLNALLQTASCLNQANIPYVFGGGLAVNFYGQHRATRDVDIYLQLDQDGLPGVLPALSKMNVKAHAYEQASYMPPDAIFWWTPLQYGRDNAAPVNVDLLTANHEFMAYLHAFGEETQIEETRLRLVSLEGILILKLRALRDKDRWDLKEIIKKNPSFERTVVQDWMKRFNMSGRLEQMECELEAEGGRRLG